MCLIKGFVTDVTIMFKVVSSASIEATIICMCYFLVLLINSTPSKQDRKYFSYSKYAMRQVM
jgi:hypothetical protein